MKTSTRTRIFSLLKMEFSSFLRSLSEHLAKKLTLLACSSVVLALVLYLAYDFAGVYLTKISPTLSLTFSKMIAFMLVSVGIFFLRKQIRIFLSPPRTPNYFAYTVGESPKVLRNYRFLLFPLFFLVNYNPVWGIAIYFFGNFSILNQFFLLLLPLILIPFSFAFKRLTFKQHSKKKKPLLKEETSSRKKALLEWRLQQILYRARTSKLCIFFSFLLAGASPFLFLYTRAHLPSMLTTFFASLLAGVALLIQIGKDFKFVWLERTSGLSHEEYLKTIFQLSNLIGFLLVFFTSFLFFLLSLFSSIQLNNLPFLVLKFATLAFIPIGSVPLIFLQIDPRKVLLHSTILGVVSLFFCSLILINLGFILLVPFIWSYGKESQANRFYTI